MPTVDEKVRVSGEKCRVWQGFSHAHEAGISEAHGYASELSHEPHHILDLSGSVEFADQSMRFEQAGECVHSGGSEQIERLRQDGFAGFPRWRKAHCFIGGPNVVRITTIQQCDQEAAVSESA